MRYAKLIVFGVGLILSNRSTAHAQSNVALGKTIIDGSGSWDGGVIGEGAPYNGGSFPAKNVVDGAITEPANGAVTYWLGREYTPDEYFTLDLGQSYSIDAIELFNSHNRQYNDRGTDEFAIFASNSIDDAKHLVNPTRILAGNLANVSGLDVIEGEFYTPATGLVQTNARYLRFDAISYYESGTNGSSGLNEIRVFDNSVISPNKALNRPIIRGTGAWSGGEVGVGVAYDQGDYPASKVTDGSVSDSPGSYWLGREGVPNESFTLDLGAPIAIKEILLRNTANSPYGDRGTHKFRILASSTLDGLLELINPTEILSGQLTNTVGVSPLMTNVFTADNGLALTTARYLKFESVDGTYFNGNVGLNEIEVYDNVYHAPTPAPRDNVAYGKEIIDGSGSWDGGVGQGAAFDGGSFPAGRVTDGSYADSNGGRNSYWLGRENEEDEYFTLDLGDVYSLDEIDLRNTHNTQYNDRGTDAFTIFGATSVDANNQLVNPVKVLQGNLTNVSSASPIPADVFTSANGLAAVDVRYLRFVANSYLSSATNGGSGLNEIEVYGRLAGGVLGDFNDDKQLTAADIDALSVALHVVNPSPRYDVNHDGSVNTLDHAYWVENLKKTYYGDANLDGLFDSTDFVQVFQIGEYEDNLNDNSTWSEGDWNGDADFDSGDFVTAFQGGGYNMGPRAAVSAVPEPATGVLFGLAALGLMMRRRK